MLCGGITGFHPLVQHNAGPNTRVGVIGIGGLGHFALMGAAQALGCKKVVAISRTSTKKEDAIKMGATDFIATSEDKDWAEKHASSLDIIVSTVSSHELPIQEYLQLLALRGVYVHVGAPEDAIPGFNMFSLIPKPASTRGGTRGRGRGGRARGKGRVARAGPKITVAKSSTAIPKPGTGRGRRQRAYQYTRAQAAYERNMELRSAYSQLARLAKPVLDEIGSREKKALMENPKMVKNHRQRRRGFYYIIKKSIQKSVKVANNEE